MDKDLQITFLINNNELKLTIPTTENEMYF